MSFQAMTWAVEKKCSSAGQKLVLMMLANYCNAHTGQCNPSHQRLADECCMGASTLKRHLSSLSDDGLIEIIHRANDGVSLPNQYLLKLDGVGPIRAGGGSDSGRGVGPNRATNQEIQPGIEPFLVADATSSPDGDGDAQTISRKDRVPIADLIAIYNKELGAILPVAQQMTEARKKALAARWREMLGSTAPNGSIRYTDKESGLAWWAKLFAKVKLNPHWLGENDNGWTANLDWIIGPKNFVKVLEYRACRRGDN